MHKFVRNLLTEWRRLGLSFYGASFIVGVSGGADSTSLVSALFDLTRRRKLDLRFVISHFDHCLRGEESSRDADFVADLAKNFGFEFRFGRAEGHLVISRKGNLEQNSRRSRYMFLNETAVAENASAILTAHTQNDQAETLLLNLIRGAGVSGLSGMRPVSEDFDVSGISRGGNKAAVVLIRPLLRWATRADAEEYCADLGLGFRNDPMNDDLAFTRVRIRKQLLPMLGDFNPKIVETLARTSTLFQAETERLPDPLFGSNLRISELQLLSKPLLYQTLRRWLETERGDLRQIGLKHIEAVDRLIFSRKSGKIVELPDGGRVIRERGKLAFVRESLVSTSPKKASRTKNTI